MFWKKTVLTGTIITILFLGLFSTGALSQELLYQNNRAYLYYLPQDGEEITDIIAKKFIEQLIQKGFGDVIAMATTSTISKLGGLFLSFLTAMPSVGVNTSVYILVFADNKITESVSAGEPFLPVIFFQPGDSFAGLSAELEISGRSGLVFSDELISFDDLFSNVDYGGHYLIVPKETIRLNESGEYSVNARVWDYGTTSTTLVVFGDVEESFGNAEEHYLRGMKYADEGNYSKAIEELTKAIEINPDYALAYTGRGVTYSLMERYNEALDDFKRGCYLGDATACDAYKSIEYLFK